jgi:hypothetical protein
MPVYDLLALGILLMVTLTAFLASVAIGFVMGRLDLDGMDDDRAVQPAGQAVARPPEGRVSGARRP